jgi:hypothetical protein
VVGGSIHATRARGGLFRWWLLCLGLLAFAFDPARAQSREYQIKAAFLGNFIQFVTWPTNAFTSQSAPFCVGVLGDDPFGSALEQTVQGETADHHKIIVRRCQRMGDCKDCQMIFVCRSQEKNFGAILDALASSPVLTVSDMRGFGRRGGIISFYLEGNKVRFEINLMAAQRDKLKISAQLLNLGKIVESAEGGK